MKFKHKIRLVAQRGIQGSIEQFTNFTRSNNLFSAVDKIFVNNPWGYYYYLKDASQLLKEGPNLVRDIKTNV